MVNGTIKKIELQSIPPLHHSMNLTAKFATQILCRMMQWKVETFFQGWILSWNLFFHVLQVCHLWKWSQLFRFWSKLLKFLPERGLSKIVYMYLLIMVGKKLFCLKNYFTAPLNQINYNYFTTVKKDIRKRLYKQGRGNKIQTKTTVQEKNIKVP